MAPWSHPSYPTCGLPVDPGLRHGGAKDPESGATEHPKQMCWGDFFAHGSWDWNCESWEKTSLAVPKKDGMWINHILINLINRTAWSGWWGWPNQKKIGMNGKWKLTPKTSKQAIRCYHTRFCDLNGPKFLLWKRSMFHMFVTWGRSQVSIQCSHINETLRSKAEEAQRPPATCHRYSATLLARPSTSCWTRSCDTCCCAMIISATALRWCPRWVDGSGRFLWPKALG